MSLLFTVLLTFIAAAQAGPPCGDFGHTCYYISDPCPPGTEDCADQYSCPLDTNKCCCKKATRPFCGDFGHTCYYISDPCPPGTEDCADQYSCPLDTNKCCCKKATTCPDDWVTNGALCYYVVNSPIVMVQSEARKRCQDLGADLPVVKSAEENAFIFSLAKETGEAWLGMHLKEDMKFYWVDGTPVADGFSAWYKGEPNHLDEEKCAYMYASGDRRGKWNNNPCDTKWRAICQKHM